MNLPGLRIDVHRVALIALVALLAFAATASPHHGIANFDVDAEIAITGTVTRLQLINPHSWLHLDVADKDGGVTSWRCELRGASVLRRSGWTAEMFAPGTTVTITGAPDRFTPNTCYLGTAVFSDGSRVDRYGQLRRTPGAAGERGAEVRGTAAVPRAERPVRLPGGQPNMAGDWAAEQRMLTDPRGMSGAFLPMSVAQKLEPGAVPEGTQAFPGARGTEVSLAENPVEAYWNRPGAFPLTEEGARAIADFDGASTDNPRLRCEPTNILFDWTFEADVNRITQADDRITLLYGSMGLERTVFLDITEHPADVAPSRAGHSIGRWEGDVLIVDTVGFEPGILSADGRIPHSDRLHVVERFTLDPAGGTLVRSYVAEDPRYLQKPYTGSDTVYLADVPYQPAPCDDQSYKKASTGTGAWPRWTLGALVALGAALLVWLARARPRPGRAG